jgi:hypothetical protein
MQRRVGLLVALIVLATLAAAVAPGAVQAQPSEASWRVFVGFEQATDGAPIDATLTDMRFSASDGATWTYADVRSGRYNAPYPLPCPDFGGTCAFAVTGNGFAWLGDTSGVGRIDFLTRITSFSAGFSTAEDLTVTAYSAGGAMLGAQTIAPNLATGRLDAATFNFADGTPIAYVLIRGGANRWIMDDLVIGADPALPPRPPPPPPAERPAEPAFVTVVQRPTPNLTAAPDSVVQLTIEVVNRGRGSARDAILTLAIDPDVVTLRDAAFSAPEAWVSQVTATEVVIRTGSLPAEAVLTITLQVYVLPTAVVDAPIGGALQARWFDGAGGGTYTANLPVLVVGATNAASATLPLHVAPAAQPGAVTLTADFYAPLEPVEIWYDSGTGTTMPLATVRTDAAGRIAVTVPAAELPASGFFVAAGHWSQLSGTGR